jgi:hypothetical protein
MRTAAQKRAELELKLAKIKNEERAEETRKKILVGSFVLSKNPDPLQIPGFAQSLTRDHDRILFGLEPIKQKNQPAEG